MKLTNFLTDMGRVIAYYPNLKKVTGSTTASILLCQFLYWSEKTREKPWIYKTSEEIEEETGLTFNEQKTAKRKLISLKILVKEYKRLEHTTRYKINYDKLNELWDSHSQVQKETKQEEPKAKVTQLPLALEVEKPAPKEKVDLPKTERTRNSDIEKQGDFVDAMLKFGVLSPEAKRAETMLKMKERIEEKLHVCADGSRWEKFIAYAYTRQERHKEPLDIFLNWAIDSGFDPIYWTPEKLRTVWPTAIEDHTKKNQPSKNFVEELPQLVEKDYAPMPKGMGVERKLY